MRIALGIEYDGSGFYGWQRQGDVRTVQGCVEAALGKVADHPLDVVCAGRTDTGVHAVGQVAHFDSDAAREPHQWVLGGNANLPGDVAILWARPVAEDFHARFSARWRRYRYVIVDRPVRPAIDRHRVSWTYQPLDVTPMAEAASHLLGEHDFNAYRAVACQAPHAVRTVHALDVRRDGEHVVIDVTANAFLHHMVRNIAGVLLAIGAGERDPDWARQVLEQRDRTLGGVTAPPDGLYLAEIRYAERFGLPGAGVATLE